MATFSAVYPPIVGSSASGRSRAMTSSTHSGVTGASAFINSTKRTILVECSGARVKVPQHL